jgi:hypothetical protein
MSRRRVLITGYLAGAVSVILALYISVLLGPVAVDYTDAEAVVTAAAEAVLSEFPSGTSVYLRSSNPPTLLDVLRHEHPILQLKKWAERPVDHGCDVTITGAAPMAPCSRNDFVYVSDVTFPIWRIGIVDIGTFNGGGPVFLVKWGEQWHVFVNRRVTI